MEMISSIQFKVIPDTENIKCCIKMVIGFSVADPNLTIIVTYHIHAHKDDHKAEMQERVHDLQTRLQQVPCRAQALARPTSSNSQQVNTRDDTKVIRGL